MFYLRADKITRKVMLKALNECLANQDELDQNPDYIALKEWLEEINEKEK